MEVGAGWWCCIASWYVHLMIPHCKYLAQTVLNSIMILQLLVFPTVIKCRYIVCNDVVSGLFQQVPDKMVEAERQNFNQPFKNTSQLSI